MDPVLGKFASEDPAKDGGNWFAYARSAPTRYVDCSGYVTGDINESGVASAGAAEIEGSGGAVSLYRGMCFDEWESIMNNAMQFVEGKDGAIWLSQFKSVAVSFASQSQGVVVRVIMSAQAYKDMISAGLIRATPNGVQCMVPNSVIAYLNSLYTAVELLT